MAVDGRLTLPTEVNYSLLVIQRNNEYATYVFASYSWFS